MKVVLGLTAGLCILSVAQATFGSSDYYRTGRRGDYDLNDYDDLYHGINKNDLHKYGKGGHYNSMKLGGLGSILGRYFNGGFKGYGNGKYDNTFYGGNGISLYKLLSYFGVGDASELLKYYGIDIRKYIKGGDHYDPYNGHDGRYGNNYRGNEYDDKYYGNKYGNKYNDKYYGSNYGNRYDDKDYGSRYGNQYGNQYQRGSKGRGYGGRYGGRSNGLYGGLLSGLSNILGSGSRYSNGKFGVF